MERLLAHPPSLPLVHVDHSHRAPAPARTGECYSISTAEVVKAKYYVRLGGEEGLDTVPKFGFYELAELECGDTSKRMVSTEETERVMSHIAFLAGEIAAERNQNRADVRSDAAPPQQFMRVNAAGGITHYLRADGKRATTKDECAQRVRNYLSQYWSEKDQPVFRADVFSE